MSGGSFLDMMESLTPEVTEEPPTEVKQKEDVSYDTSMIKAYSFMYDKKNQSKAVEATYKFIVERPPKKIDAVEVALSYFNSLTEAELDKVVSDLSLQIKTSSAKIDVVSEYKKLDEMAQYKFFCGVRDMYDLDDWKTLTDTE